MDNFARFFLLALFLCILIRISYQHYDDQKQVAKSFVSIQEIILFSGVIIFGCIMPFYTKVYMSEYDYNVPLKLKYLGIIFAILMIVVFWMAHNDLERQFSPTLKIKNNHKLITSGIYQYIRHPMYLSLILTTLSQSLLLPNKLTTSSFIIALLFILLIRIPNEEKMLQLEFGEKYFEYMKHTNGLIPFL